MAGGDITITCNRRFVDPKGEVLHLSRNEHTLFEKRGPDNLKPVFTSCEFFERYKEVVRKAFKIADIERRYARASVHGLI